MCTVWLRFYSYYVFVPCTLVAVAHAAPQMFHVVRKNMNATRTFMTKSIALEWFSTLCILEFRFYLCSNASNFYRFVAVLSSLYMHKHTQCRAFWCVLNTYESIIAHQQHKRTYRFACRTFLSFTIPFWMLVRWFIVDCLYSSCCRLRLVRNIHSAWIVVQNRIFLQSPSHEIFFYVRSFVYVAFYLLTIYSIYIRTKIVSHRNSDRHFFLLTGH